MNVTTGRGVPNDRGRTEGISPRGAPRRIPHMIRIDTWFLACARHAQIEPQPETIAKIHMTGSYESSLKKMESDGIPKSVLPTWIGGGVSEAHNIAQFPPLLAGRAAAALQLCHIYIYIFIYTYILYVISIYVYIFDCLPTHLPHYLNVTAC